MCHFLVIFMSNWHFKKNNFPICLTNFSMNCTWFFPFCLLKQVPLDLQRMPWIFIILLENFSCKKGLIDSNIMTYCLQTFKCRCAYKKWTLYLQPFIFEWVSQLVGPVFSAARVLPVSCSQSDYSACLLRCEATVYSRCGLHGACPSPGLWPAPICPVEADMACPDLYSTPASRP